MSDSTLVLSPTLQIQPLAELGRHVRHAAKTGTVSPHPAIACVQVYPEAQAAVATDSYRMSIYNWLGLLDARLSTAVLVPPAWLKHPVRGVYNWIEQLNAALLRSQRAGVVEDAALFAIHTSAAPLSVQQIMNAIPLLKPDVPRTATIFERRTLLSLTDAADDERLHIADRAFNPKYIKQALKALPRGDIAMWSELNGGVWDPVVLTSAKAQIAEAGQIEVVMPMRS